MSRTSVLQKLAVLMCMGCATVARNAKAAPFAYVPAGSSVVVVDTATDTVSTTIGFGNDVNGIAVNVNGTFAYAAVGTTLKVINASTNTIAATVPNLPFPFGVSINPAGTRVYVANHTAPDSVVSVVDTSTNTLTGTISGFSGSAVALAVHPAGNLGYVSQSAGNVKVVDLSTNTVTATVSNTLGGWGVAVNPAGTRVYVGDYQDHELFVIDTSTNTLVTTIDLGANAGVFPAGIAVSPDGHRVYVSTARNSSFAQVVTVVDADANTVLDHLIPSPPRVVLASAGIALNPAGTKVYLAPAQASATTMMAVFDAGTNAFLRYVDLGPLFGWNNEAFGQFISPPAPPCP